MDKLCISCNIVKSVDYFPSGKNQCKSCKAKYVAQYRSSKKQDSSKQDIKSMREQVTKITSILDEIEDSRERYAELSKIIRNMHKLNEQASNGIMLELKLKIPEELHIFLIQINGGDPNTNYATVNLAKMYLTNDNYKNGFENQFGTEREELVQYVELLTDIHHITSLVKCAYLALIDDYIAKNNSKFVPTSEHVVESVFKTNVIIRFDADGDCIIADENPLKLNKAAFMIGLDNLISREISNVIMYQRTGYYDKLKTLLI